MTDIGKGDIVECIRSKRLTIGALFCVADVVPMSLACDCHGLTPFGLVLRGAPHDRGDVGWCGLNFRPVKRRDEAFLASLLSDVPTDLPVEA
jgi:hypothetical protein